MVKKSFCYTFVIQRTSRCLIHGNLKLFTKVTSVIHSKDVIKHKRQIYKLYMLIKLFIRQKRKQ